jgi:lariat debranching enzyme
VDVGLSHDWIRGIEFFGDTERLFRKKKDFRHDSREGKLGNLAAREVVDRLRPGYWFSAHLHVKFAAAMPHDNVPLQKTVPSADQPAEWAVDIAGPVTPDISSASLALDSNVSSKVSPDTTVSKAIPRATGDEPTRLAAWNNFHSFAIKSEGEANLSLRERLQQAGPQTIRAEANHEWRRIRI